MMEQRIRRQERADITGRQKETQARPTARTRPLILIAERDPFMQDRLKQVLEPQFEVQFVEDGAAAVEEARRNHPDLVILEALLPTMDGFQTCRRLKSLPQTRDIPILFFSLLLAEERAAQVGADGFLLKPLGREALLKRIQDLLTVRPASGPDEKGKTND